MTKTAILQFQKDCAAHGLSTDTVCDRLQEGCSLFAALNIPGDLKINVKSIYPGKIHYTINKVFLAECCVFDGTENDLREFIEERKRNT
ncbi:MAG: hypothetical protein HDT35_08645 [Clostridiales bacterium]|nr:hypothetical protein [Clostridiales bacterium]